MSPSNFRTLDLNLLRVFDEVMTERSLTRAAHKLSLTQPAVSNALRRLRVAMGDDLIKRSGQAMAPTPRALALWPVVREALRQLQEVVTPSNFVPGVASTTFVLAMADATAAVLMPGLIEVMDRDAPGVSIRVVPLTTRDPRHLLDAQAVDLAIGYFPAAFADLTARAQAGEAVALFDVIETIDRPKIARTVADEIQKQGRGPRLLVQVNTGDEPQKAGVAPDQTDAFIASCRAGFGLAIEGLMCIPPAEEPPAPHFALLAKIAARNGVAALSMGMSGDYEIAAQLGATHVRIGTALFGARGVEAPAITSA